ncbi:hypothetical protein BM74_13980 [Bacillus thuringiensis]|uniref:Mobilization protein n=1 Tax=Bacillus thuringiensis TaxID=1428 RepID=A0A437SKB9_BACTU|nr:plasmid recombination protein [Bacillus thuringiensis]RVU63628.1 hypothetical protein BM74_13980 [Bacillus thuringiensis]
MACLAEPKSLAEHVQKYTKGNVQGLSIHWDRKTENHSNLDIDNERSDLSYDLCEKEGDTFSRMQDRLSEVHSLNRADLQVCGNWVVTLPENLKGASEKEQRQFFEKTYEFLTDRYGGEKNVLSVNVHNDETTPHISAKKTMFGDKVTLLSKDFEKLKDLSVSSMKVQYQAKKRIAAATEKIEELEEQYYEVDRRADNVEFQFGLLEKEVNQLKEHRIDAIIYKSMLQDINRDVEISETEKKERLILHNLENGYKPKNRQEGEQWLSILEENKKANTIPQKHLDGFIERLKAFLDKMWI